MIRYEYPRLHTWLRNLYWDPSGVTNGAFRDTVNFELVSLQRLPVKLSLTETQYKQQYAHATVSPVYPKGPVPHILPL
jgi:glutathionyl-hydroquinone reductase